MSSQRGAVLPLSEDEIKAAIEELDRSTEAISKQDRGSEAAAGGHWLV